MIEVIVQRIDWRKTLLGIRPGKSYTKRKPSLKEVNAAKQMACTLKRECVAEFSTIINDNGDFTITRER